MNGMERIAQGDLRRIQMGLLDEFAQRCAELDLRWFVTGGTMLGAVRHSGYIPWDDDIDVMMSRPDYERFCSSFVDGGEVRLASSMTDRSYPFPYAKLYDPRSKVIEHYDPMPHYGVHIDIFPLDGWPKAPWLARGERMLVRLLRLLLGGRIVVPAAMERGPSRWLVRAVRFALRPIHPAVLGRLLTRVATREPRPGGRCGIVVWGGAESVPFEAFRTSVLMPFEGGEVPVPSGWHDCLSAYYGMYMELPPESERVGHPLAIPYRVAAE